MIKKVALLIISVFILLFIANPRDNTYTSFQQESDYLQKQQNCNCIGINIEKADNFTCWGLLYDCVIKHS